MGRKVSFLHKALVFRQNEIKTLISPGVKRQGRGVNHQTPFSAEVKGRIELHLCSSLWAFVACYNLNFTFNLTLHISHVFFLYFLLSLHNITFLYVAQLSVFIDWRKESLSKVGAGRAWGVTNSILRSQKLVNSDIYQ